MQALDVYSQARVLFDYMNSSRSEDLNEEGCDRGSSWKSLKSTRMARPSSSLLQVR